MNRNLARDPNEAELLEAERQREESLLDRTKNPSECALGFFRYNGPGSVDYYSFAQKLQESQGRFRGGGGRGLVINGMTQARALDVLKNADTRPRALRTFGNTRRVDLSEAQNLEVIQLHASGRDIDTILNGIRKTDVRPLYVESIATNPGALGFRTYRDTFGAIDPQNIPQTYLRVFVDNSTGKSPVELQQLFHLDFARHGPVVMSWSGIAENAPGLMCYRIAGRDEEFDGFFRDDLVEFPATEFGSHSRYPTQQGKPGVEDSQPRVQGDIWSMHNGDQVNEFAIKERLRDPFIHAAERQFFETYGQPDKDFKKFRFRHIAGVDSAAVAKLHAYLFDCCKHANLDPIIISIIERPPSLTQIAAMPPAERKFFMLARAAFPEIAYQGSAATIVRTGEYVRITPDRTRVAWIAKDRDGNVYVASNGGAITHACPPDLFDPSSIRPVPANEILDINLKDGSIKNAGMDFHLPDGNRSIFMPGIGFDRTRLHELKNGNSNGNLEAKKRPLEKGEELDIPKEISPEFGIYGFELSDVERLVHYGNTGTYKGIGLGNAEPDGIMKRSTLLSHLSSTHQAFIVSPGRDNRIEFSGKMLLRHSSGEPVLLRSPLLFGSAALRGNPEGDALLREIAGKYGVMFIDDLEKQTVVKATYRPEEKLADAIKRVIEEVNAAARSGAINIILDDATTGDEIPMPPSTVIAAVHRELRTKGVPVKIGNAEVHESLRSRVNLVGRFRGVTNAEEWKECVMHGADAVCPELAFDAAVGLFGKDLDGHLTEGRAKFAQRAFNAAIGLKEDFAIAAGSSGFHDINAMRGNAAGMEQELGVASDWNHIIGDIPGMNAGGIDLATLDLFLRSRIAQHGGKQIIGKDDLPHYHAGWERWNERILTIITRMTHDGASYEFNPEEYAGIRPATMEDLVQIKGLEKFKNFSDEEIRDIRFMVLDFMAVAIAHMSIGALDIETWISMLAALYEIRHEAQEGKIPFLSEEEILILAGIGEGGIAAELRPFLAHIVGQYASGRFGLETNDGDIFDRGHLMEEGLLRMKGIADGEFNEEEISDIERLIVRLVKSEHIEKDIAAAESGELGKLMRFIAIVSLKNAQDAKRGYGGMLTKTVEYIAKIRGVTPHDAIKSFFNHADGDSIEELRERLFAAMREASGEIPELGDNEACMWGKEANDPYAVPNAFGEVKAGAVMRDLDWRGGTGNRPYGTKRASHPWLAEAVRFDALDRSMLGQMTKSWMSSNRTPVDGFRNMLLGNVDGLLIASSVLGAMKCIFGKCRNCHTGKCGPVLTPQEIARRKKLYDFDETEPENPDSRKVDAKTQKERAKRFMLAFIRTMKVLMKNIGAGSVEEVKWRREKLLEVSEGIEVEGAEHIRSITNHPYDKATVERACSVSERFDVGKFIKGEKFPEVELQQLIKNYLALSTNGVPNEALSRNSFLLVGDIANVFPRLSRDTRSTFWSFLEHSIRQLEGTYRRFISERDGDSFVFTPDSLLERHGSLDFLRDRDEQEFLERLITAYRIREIIEKFSKDGDEHDYGDKFFSRTVHSKNPEISIKSPRAIVSQENGFTIDRYRGAQRKVAAAVVKHVRESESKTPLVIEIDDVMTDADMGILTCLNGLYHSFPDRFDATVESIELRLKRGVSGHNLGALANGNYLFDSKEGAEKLRIVVGSPKEPAHGDGSVGMSINGGEIIVNGYIGDCGGAYASDLKLAARGSVGKLGMGAKGNTFIYCHEPLQDVAGIGMNGNATIFCAGRNLPGEERRAIAKPGLGGDMKGLSRTILACTLEELKAARVLGVGAVAAKTSRLDEKRIAEAYALHFHRYEPDGHLPHVGPANHSKVVSEFYHREFVKGILLENFSPAQDETPFETVLESAAGELLVLVGMDDRLPENEPFMRAAVELLKQEKADFENTVGKSFEDNRDAGILKARDRAQAFLAEFKADHIKFLTPFMSPGILQSPESGLVVN